MRSLEVGRAFRVSVGLFMAALAGVRGASAAPPPTGLQKVLVIPMNLGATLAELCPDPNNCPAQVKTDAPYYQAPRHSPQDWDNLLNNYGTRFWQLASYGQTQAQFTLLPSLFSQSGWWKPPHAAADYYVNGDLWQDTKTFAFVEDAVRGAIQTYCFFGFCSVFNQFERVILLSNNKARGGVTNGQDVFMTVHTAYGNYNFTASFVNESSSDSDALSVTMHEFGHQLGVPTHYGDCVPFYQPAFNGQLECVGAWDVMGFDWAWSQPTGYSRISRGWIDPQTTLSYDLLSGVPFSTLTFIRPVSQAPNGVPNLIRLSIGGLDWPQFFGYFAECRRRIGGDEGLYPASTGIYREGLLITRIHEFDPSPSPVHVVRQSFPPASDPSTSILQPGDSFTDPQLGLFVRLNGYAGDDAEPLCDVEVDYLSPPRTGPILLWQNRVTPEPVPSFRSFDIGLNHPAPPGDPGSGGAQQPLMTAPVWPRHGNALLVRAHTAGTLPAENVQLNVSITQPALFTSGCGTFTAPNQQQVSLPAVDPATGAVAMLGFKARRGSLGIQMFSPADPAGGRDASNVVASRSAFQFFGAGMASPQRTHLTLRANEGCAGETTFHVALATAPPGWQVSISPEVIAIAPGAQADVAVTVTPPAGAQPGENAEIGIKVLEAEETARDAPPDRPLEPIMLQHLDSIGSMQISARVVGEPAAVNLTCAGAAPGGGAVAVSGNITPLAPNSTVLLEYRSFGAARPSTRLVTTDAAGAFSDGFSPSRPHGHVQAFWPGDATHAPAQSSRCPF